MKLHRLVSRHTPEVIARLDHLAARATDITGSSVSRSAVLRAVMTCGFDLAQRSDEFAVMVSKAIIKRGKKKKEATNV